MSGTAKIVLMRSIDPRSRFGLADITTGSTARVSGVFVLGADRVFPDSPADFSRKIV